MVVNPVAAAAVRNQQCPKGVPAEVPIPGELGQGVVMRVTTYVGGAKRGIDHRGGFKWLLAETGPGSPSGIPALVANGHEDPVVDGDVFVEMQRVQADAHEPFFLEKRAGAQERLRQPCVVVRQN